MKTLDLKFGPAKTIAILALAAGMVFAGVNSAQAVSFNYLSSFPGPGNVPPGGAINFPGNTTFNFSPTSNNFQVLPGSTAFNFFGEITGTYTIGTISMMGPIESAPVTGMGMFVIHDPGDGDLTANLSFVPGGQAIVITPQFGGATTAGSLNTILTNIMYAGSNPDLLALANAGHAFNLISFQLSPALSLDTLRNGPGSHSTTFSGNVVSVATPDGGTTVALLGLALTGLEGLRRLVKKKA